jgi:hypothetical protein
MFASLLLITFSEGVRNTTTVFDRPARERVRPVSDLPRVACPPFFYLTGHSLGMYLLIVCLW